MQNATLGSAVGSRKWLNGQVSGEFVNQTLDTLANSLGLQALRRCLIGVGPAFKPHVDDAGGIQIAREDDMSAYLAGACFLHQVAAPLEVCVCVWMAWDLPVRFAVSLGSRDVRVRTVASFKQDLQAYELLKDHANLSSQAEMVLEHERIAHLTKRLYSEVLCCLVHCALRSGGVMVVAQCDAPSCWIAGLRLLCVLSRRGRVVWRCRLCPVFVATPGLIGLPGSATLRFLSVAMMACYIALGCLACLPPISSLRGPSLAVRLHCGRRA